jgi:hypothetical protein
MTIKTKPIFLIAALPLIFVGCAATSPKAALSDVNKTVMARTGQQMSGMSNDVVNVLLQMADDSIFHRGCNPCCRAGISKSSRRRASVQRNVI